MRHLFDYGEALLCFVPVFMIIAFTGAALLWNSLPSQRSKKTKDDESPDRH